MPPRHSRQDPFRAVQTLWFTAASGALLFLCWAMGGVTVDSTSADELVQLFALPIVLLASWRLAEMPIDRTLGLVLAFAAVVTLVPLWQLLPLPSALGMAGEARAAIIADLAMAGITLPAVHASLWPRATEQSLWSLLPALALFLAVLTLNVYWRRRLLQLVLVLVLASAAFAFFQLSLPVGSPMLLYTSGGRNFGGLFVNSNHQGTALILGGVIAVALFIEARRRARDDEGGHRYWLYAVMAAACVVMVPLAKGSAAALLVLVGLVAVALMMGVLRRRSDERDSISGSTAVLLRLAGVGLAVAVVVASALAWRQADTGRQQIAQATVEIGTRFAPLGTGVGSFVPVFAQAQDPRQARSDLINHAHNEYTQWWLEAGVPALLVLVAALGLFAWAGWQVLTGMESRRLRAVAAPAWTGLLILLLHSLVDFPLRTTALMATAGLLAGLLLATLADARRDDRRRVHRVDAAQQA